MSSKKERESVLKKTVRGKRGKEIWRKWSMYVQGQTRARVGEQRIERESFRVQRSF